MPPPRSCGTLKMLNCLVSRSWPCQSIWDVALEERGSEPTWLSSRWCCPSSQRFQYDYVAQTHLHTTPSDCTSVSDLSSFVCQHRWLACFSHQTDLYSGALFVQVCLGWNLYLSTVLMLVVTALYTIAGRYRYPIFWNVRLGTCLFLCANKISVFQVVSLLSFTQTPSRRLSCSLVQLS